MGNKIALKPSNRFIVEHNKLCPTKITDMKSLDQRRVIFVSLNGLYSTFDQCPSVILYSAICLMPLKKKWIYHPRRYMNEIKQRHEIYTLLNQKDKTRINRFIDLLLWKDSQGLVFWMIDEKLYSDNHRNNDVDSKQSEEIVTPFWRYFSKKLTSLYDPITNSNYNPIICDKTFWRDIYNKNENCLSKYGVKSHSIFMELFCLSLSMKYKPLQEIIYQSNPKSLNPLTSYSVENDQSCPSTCFTTTINDDNGWVMTCDYD